MTARSGSVANNAKDGATDVGEYKLPPSMNILKGSFTYTKCSLCGTSAVSFVRKALKSEHWIAVRAIAAATL
jgi:hypothetical protein